METALLILNATAVTVLVFTSLRNDRMGPGQAPTGPFRYVVEAARRVGRGNGPTPPPAA